MRIQATDKVNFGLVRGALLLFLVAGLIQLQACGHKGAGGAAKPGQTIARVNGDEITIVQLNYELQRSNINVAQQDIASKKIVEGLIDRQLVTQAAVEAKLDRNPRVLIAIENAKAMVLAQAYLESKTASVSKPSDAEVKDYYNKHPDIFANRKVYLMDELSLSANSYSKELNNVADAAKTLEEIMAWLDKNGVAYNHAQAAHAAETLPEVLRTQLLKMVVGDIVFIRAREGNIIGRIQAVKEAPLTEETARPFIERGLYGEKRKQAAKTEMDSLRKAAKIVFLDDKYKLGNTASAAQKPMESAKAVDAPKPAESPQPASNQIVKGLGL
ncbi:MAG: EpsD family peptidyl-prolyl cis-trans isomerase [Methylophilaceae bacterium]